MTKKMSLKEYLNMNEKKKFKPKTFLEKISNYAFRNIVSFLNRNEKIILDITLKEHKFRNITNKELLQAKKDTDVFYREQEEQEYEEKKSYLFDDFILYDFNEKEKYREQKEEYEKRKLYDDCSLSLYDFN